MVPMHALKKERRLPTNLPRVAAEVTRRTLFDHSSFRLLTSAATVQGFNARIGSGKSLPIHPPRGATEDGSDGERDGVRALRKLRPGHDLQGPNQSCAS